MRLGNKRRIIMNKRTNCQAAQKKDAQEIGNEPPGQGIDFTVEGIMNLSTATWFLSSFSSMPLTL